MSKIKTATIELANFSKFRTKKAGMSAVALIDALHKGADFLAHNIDGKPCLTYCSLRDMQVGSRVEIVEIRGFGHETVWSGSLVDSDFIGHTIDIIA